MIIAPLDDDDTGLAIWHMTHQNIYYFIKLNVNLHHFKIRNLVRWKFGCSEPCGWSGKIYRGLVLQVNRLGNLKTIVLRNEFKMKVSF